jgi:hypoxanthine phosphoribosyltransferase
VLFPAEDIAARVESLAATLAVLPERPQIAVPILVGAFVFAADLMRALAARSLHLETELIWLRSYGEGRVGGALTVVAGPSARVKDKHVLLIDGILDKGHTMRRAVRLVEEAGARSIRSAVAVDKRLDDAVMKADFALYTGVKEFIVGYGADDAGGYRGLPYIGKLD